MRQTIDDCARVFEFLEDRALLHAELASIASEPEPASTGRDTVGPSDAAPPGVFSAAGSNISADHPFHPSGNTLGTSTLQIDFGDAPDLPAGSLTTTMDGDFRTDGHMFDITALSVERIRSPAPPSGIEAGFALK